MAQDTGLTSGLQSSSVGLLDTSYSLLQLTGCATFVTFNFCAPFLNSYFSPVGSSFLKVHDGSWHITESRKEKQSLPKQPRRMVSTRHNWRDKWSNFWTSSLPWVSKSPGSETELDPVSELDLFWNLNLFIPGFNVGKECDEILITWSLETTKVKTTNLLHLPHLVRHCVRLLWSQFEHKQSGWKSVLQLPRFWSSRISCLCFVHHCQFSFHSIFFSRLNWRI